MHGPCNIQTWSKYMAMLFFLQGFTCFRHEIQQTRNAKLAEKNVYTVNGDVESGSSDIWS